jgi:sulfur carrier protein
MQLTVNGQDLHISADATVAILLQRPEYAGRRVAVEVNGAIVPRSQYDATRLTNGDRVEVVQAIGGG